MLDTTVITEFFNYVDADHDGFITIDEIKEACKVDIDADGVFSEQEKQQCARIWLDVVMPLQDLNGDTKLSLAELIAYNSTIP